MFIGFSDMEINSDRGETISVAWWERKQIDGIEERCEEEVEMVNWGDSLEISSEEGYRISVYTLGWQLIQ